MTNQAYTAAISRERALAGSLLLYPEAMGRYLDNLSAGDFIDQEARTLWKVAQNTPDHLDWLAAAQHQGLTAAQYSALIDEPGISLSAAPWLVDKVREAALLRRLRQELEQAFSAIDPGETISRAAAAVEAARSGIRGQLEDMPQQQARSVVEALQNGDMTGRVFTPWPALDRLTNGLQPGSVSVLGASPSAGKTTAALNIAAQAFRSGQRTVFFSLEMSAAQLWERLAANAADISYRAITTRCLQPEEQRRVSQHIQAMAETKLLWFFDSLRYVEQFADRLARLTPGLAIVDYLQLVRTREELSNRVEQLEYLTGEFKRLAREYGCHILLLSQQTRSAAADRAPSMFALKGSGGIEAGGDYIALLDRPQVYDGACPAEQAELKLAKNKYGCCGNIPLYFDGDRQRFRELLPGESWPDKQENRPEDW